jgi:hypothetical protein
VVLRINYLVKLQLPLQLEVLLFQQVQLHWRGDQEWWTAGLAGGATITTDIGLMHHCWDVTLSDDNLDVSGTGTFGEAVTINNWRSCCSAGAATIGVGDQDWWTIGSAGVCTITDTGLMVTAGDVTLSGWQSRDVSGAWNIR